MYYLEKHFEISASHHLTLSYESKCSQVHGHNWHVTVYCKARELNQDGMVEDFAHIKQLIHGKAENIARWIVDQLPTCYKAKVQESDNNIAIYEIDE